MTLLDDKGATDSLAAALAAGVRRLNWGCGDWPEGGWINSDIKDSPGVHIARDIRYGLPLETGSMEYAVSVHALPEIGYPDQVPALRELRRVLRPGGVLRLALPDLDKGIRAYLDEDREYFLVPDKHARSIGAKLITQVLWYGWSRTLFTFDFLAEMLEQAGFANVSRCSYRQTDSPYPDIIQHDSRERESFYAEAVK